MSFCLKFAVKRFINSDKIRPLVSGNIAEISRKCRGNFEEISFFYTWNYSIYVGKCIRNNPRYNSSAKYPLLEGKTFIEYKATSISDWV